ncbi:MAG: porin, partial [Aestuariibacter sp.]|nr:porin [Aestuariibacter sp.]
MPIHANAEVNLSGFASIVGGTSTDSDAFVRGYEDSIDFKEHSFFALQAYSDLGDGLSATAQIRSRGRDDWEPEFTWAFLSYEISPSWRIQAGRQR